MYFSFEFILLCFVINVSNKSSSCKPIFLSRKHFILSTKVTGEYTGRKCLELRNHDSEKTKKLSLGDYHCRSDDGVHDMVDDPNDPFCVVKLYEQIESFMPPKDSDYNVGRILRRRANDKELKVNLFC